MEKNIRDNRNVTLQARFLRNLLHGNEIAGWDSPQSEPPRRLCLALRLSFARKQSLGKEAWRPGDGGKISNSGKGQVMVVCSFIQSKTGAGRRTGCYKK